MALRAKKAPDFSETGNWCVIDERGEIYCVMFFDRQSNGWYDESRWAVGSYAFSGFLGDNKNEALDKLERRRRGE